MQSVDGEENKLIRYKSIQPSSSLDIACFVDRFYELS